MQAEMELRNKAEELIGKEVFTFPDREFARRILSRSSWTTDQAGSLVRVIKKYDKEFAFSLPEWKKKKNYRAASREGEDIILDFSIQGEDFQEELERIKKIPGAIYIVKRKLWSVPLNSYSLERIKEMKYVLDSPLLEFSKLKKGTAKKKEYQILQEKKKGKSRYPFQVEGIRLIDSFDGRVLLADEQGCGKTNQALGYLQLYPELRPALVISPATAKINWGREIDLWLGEKYTILNGRNSVWPTKINILICNYDILPDYIDLMQTSGFKIMIADEVQLIKSVKAKRTKAVKFLSKKIDKFLPLSGTPALNRAIELYPVLNMLQPKMFPNEYKFGQEYTNAEYNGYGWKYSGSKNMEELHKVLIQNCMIRRLKKDVLPELPGKIRTVVPLEIDNRDEYNYAREELIRWIQEQEGDEAALRAMRAEILVRFSKLKQLAVKGKLSQVLSWIDDFYEAGNEKLVVFCTHHLSIDTLFEKYKDFAVKLDGRDSSTQKQEAVDHFQNDPSKKLFIGNIKAAGSAITLTASENVVFMELGWTPGEHDQAEDRCNRIGTKNTTNVYYLVGVNTVEDEIAQLLDDKRKELSAVLNGEEAESETLLKELMKNYGG